MHLRFIWVLLVCLATVQLYAQDVDIYDESHSRMFAEYLTKSSQHDLAISEYERLLFFDSANLKYQLGLVYNMRLAGKGALVSDRLAKIHPDLCDLSADLARERLKSMLLAEIPNPLYLKCNANLPNKDKANYLLASQLISGKFSIDENAVLETKTDLDERLVKLAYQDVPHVNPRLAAIMSAIVPGSGKIYARRWKDGVFALFVVSGFAYQSFSGFQKKGSNSLVGWGFGALGTGYYLGTIYGSYKSAVDFNYSQSEKVKHELKEIVADMD
jgi:hypothetical protein